MAPFSAQSSLANRTFSSGLSSPFPVTISQGEESIAAEAQVTVNTTADGQATGTVTLVQPPVALTARNAVIIATGPITGTVDLSTGVINLSGQLENPPLPPLTVGVSGTLPILGGSAGSLTLQLGDQQFTHPWDLTAPPNPQPTPSGSPVPTPSGSPIPGIGGTAALQFSAVSAGTTADTTPLTSSGIGTTVAGIVATEAGNEVVTVVVTGLTSSFAPRSVSISVVAAGRVTPGIYPVVLPSNSSDLPRAQVIVDQGIPPSFNRFAGRAGRVVVTERSDTTVTFRLESVPMQPNLDFLPPDTTNTAQGGFEINGETQATALASFD
ncbi:MAG: hypothetical protein OHK0012_05400 [Synechococcales cyanobacterium]